MRQVVGKNIAYLYARAWILNALAVVFVCAVGSTGLIASAQAAAKAPPRQRENSAQSINLQEIKQIQTLRVIRTNIANKAFEELTVQEKTATLKRSTGFQKTLALEEGVFAAMEQKMRVLGVYELETVKPAGGVKVDLVFHTADGETKVSIDPAGRLQSLYSELMDIRNVVLSDGK